MDCYVIHAKGSMVAQAISKLNSSGITDVKVHPVAGKNGAGFMAIYFEADDETSDKLMDIGSYDVKYIGPKTVTVKARQDKIPGGIADDMEPSDFPKEALKEGIKHELEHTVDAEIAEEIAMDHLAEDPEYYKKIKKIEGSKKEDVFALQLVVNGKRKASNQLNSEEAKNFLIAARHLSEYLQREYEV